MGLRCSSCGGVLNYSPKHKLVCCINCGDEYPIVDKKVVEPHPLVDGCNKSIVGKLEDSCKFCGALIELDEGEVSTLCEHCDSPYIREFKNDSEIFDVIVPFAISKNEALDIFTNWAKSESLVADNFSRLCSISKISGSYLPYWFYSCDAHVDFEIYNGVDIPDESLYDDVVFKLDNLPVHSREEDDWVLGLHNNCVENYKAFSEEYLLGFKSKSFESDVNGCMRRFKDLADRKARLLLKEEKPVISPKYNRDKFKIRAENVKWRYALIPMWEIEYNYQFKKRIAYIHGETGEVMSSPPVSWIKVTLLVIVILLILNLDKIDLLEMLRNLL